MKGRDLLIGFLICTVLLLSGAVASDRGPVSSESASSSISEGSRTWSAPEPLRMLETLHEQQQQMAAELRAIKREIAALKTAMNEPDLKDILGGIGYILGLCGIAFYVHARRRNGRPASRPG